MLNTISKNEKVQTVSVLVTVVVASSAHIGRKTTNDRTGVGGDNSFVTALRDL